VLDAGALIAIDRGERASVARLYAARQAGLGLRSNAMVVAQAWRDPGRRQAALARLLAAVDVRSVTERDGRAAGQLLARAGNSDAIDATVALLAEPGDRILTSDPADLASLTRVAGKGVIIFAC
jgi:DNA-binding transcriptional MocR family regulator